MADDLLDQEKVQRYSEKVKQVYQENNFEGVERQRARQELQNVAEEALNEAEDVQTAAYSFGAAFAKTIESLDVDDIERDPRKYFATSNDAEKFLTSARLSVDRNMPDSGSEILNYVTEGFQFGSSHYDVESPEIEVGRDYEPESPEFDFDRIGDLSATVEEVYGEADDDDFASWRMARRKLSGILRQELTDSEDVDTDLYNFGAALAVGDSESGKEVVGNPSNAHSIATSARMGDKDQDIPREQEFDPLTVAEGYEDFQEVVEELGE